MGENVKKQDEILDAISKLTVIELSELIKAMEEKFDVSASAAAAVAPAGAAAPAAAAGEEKTEFDAILSAARFLYQSSPSCYIIGFKEAKDLVDSAPEEGVQKRS